MEGYAVFTSEGDHFGHVERVDEGILVVEHGALHHRLAVPHEFAHVDEAQQQIHLTVSKELLHDAPRVHGNDAVDHNVVAAFYGYAD